MTEKQELDYEMEEEYDLENSRPSPYAARARVAKNLVQIEPELYAAFPSSEAVNDALRIVLEANLLVMKARTQQQKAS